MRDMVTLQIVYESRDKQTKELWVNNKTLVEALAEFVKAQKEDGILGPNDRDNLACELVKFAYMLTCNQIPESMAEVLSAKWYKTVMSEWHWMYDDRGPN